MVTFGFPDEVPVVVEEVDGFQFRVVGAGGVFSGAAAEVVVGVGDGVVCRRGRRRSQGDAAGAAIECGISLHGVILRQREGENNAEI